MSVCHGRAHASADLRLLPEPIPGRSAPPGSSREVLAVAPAVRIDVSRSSRVPIATQLTPKTIATATVAALDLSQSAKAVSTKAR